MSIQSEPTELDYPSKPDANGYAKKYYKRRAFYFGPHNSPESYLLFGEWKRRLVETGVATEVKTIRKDLAQKSVPSPHLPLGGPPERKPLQIALITCVTGLMIFISVFVSVKILSSTTAPMVDGISLTNEEIDFIRGIRRYDNSSKKFDENQPARIRELTTQLMNEGSEHAKNHMEDLDF